MARKRTTLGKWTRRSFLATAGIVGGGLALGLTLSPNRLKMADPDTAEKGETILNTWVKITPDNRITVLTPHAEMGQGAGTGLAQMLAEEMDADWDQIQIVQAPATDAYTNSDLGRGYIVGEGARIPAFAYPMLDFAFFKISENLVGQLTGGSTAIRLTGHHGMRRAGAAAREMLVKAAAVEWDVPAGTLVASKGTVSDPKTGQSASYGALAARAADFTPSLKPVLKSPDAYTIVGTSRPRLDLPGKVTGAAQFGMDVTLPGMVYAAVALPPVLGARATAVDQSGLPTGGGVGEVVNIGRAVAVTADSYWTAARALEALQITWDGGQPDLSSDTIRAAQDADLTDKEREVMDRDGDVDAALERGTPISLNFSVPYLAHATMEPMNCTIWVRDGACDVWVGHQNQIMARNWAARRLDLTPDQVTMHPVYLGGGFGRRAEMDVISIAGAIGDKIRQPVKVIWSREEDMANGAYRPAILSRMTGTVEDGKITAIHHTYIDADSGMPDSERPFGLQYDIPNRNIARIKCPSPLPVGTWRAVDFTQMGFFHESFMDALAAEAGADPLAFRLDHTSDPRIRAVLEHAREVADWETTLPAGHGRGIAMVKSFETIVAQVVEVRIDAGRAVHVPRVTSVVDCGRVINPDAAEAQITGSVIFGLTAALYGEITVANGQIQQRNFPDYDMLRLANAPVQAVHFMESDHPPGGLGEPGVPPVAPALANALFQATGERIQTLPITKHGFAVA
ncbi:molybdopterin cofactor-binding domain-containing protein [Actibacterium sp. 188UL27-1]|uniref:xanthine dehydrogenase family protein molybdopterin-binding subunit n=1 Tax=Actibacterium sp. 188UL27-1 TaxID=2786961 RepID=UPI00195DA1CD|nr:molybdopterin cofactor-binding domain-containing protein [Actibacterium sp. 188UL27-1]MBM7067468.1 xanthine dehydrogenase family protein molybdopterin-binding subunit [Actibacterium sp. 188UL27-1]